MKKDQSLLYIVKSILAWSLILHFLIWIGEKYLFADFVLANIPIHSALEMAGSMLAVALGLFLFNQLELSGDTDTKLIHIGSALIIMGFFDGLHAMVAPGKVFVFLHSLASLGGGLAFMGIFIAPKISRLASIRYCAATIFLSLLLGFASLIYDDLVPKMVEANGSFSGLSRFMNMGGFVFLFLAGVYLVYCYHKTDSISDLLFSLHCFSFSAASIMFEYSKLWNFSWWGWHVLRFSAYLVALAIVVYLWFSDERTLKLKNQVTIEEKSRELEMIQRRLKFSLETSNIGTWSFNLSSSELWWDDQMYRIFGLDNGIKVDAELWQEKIQHEDRDKLRRIFDLDQDERCEEELRFSAEKSELKYMKIIAMVFQDSFSQSDYVIGVGLDISNQKQDELKLRLAKTEAEKASAAKSLFLSNMSHEIRTPLNGIIGLSNELLERINPKDNFYRPMKTIVRSGDSLLSLINDILDLSKMEAGKMDIDKRPVNLNDFMENTIDLYRGSSSKKGIILNLCVSTTKDETLLLDEVRVQQIMGNLISNAIKFSPEKSKIKIFSSIINKKDQSLLEIKVVDCGIGMDNKTIDRLFKPFTQADMSTTRRFGGTGLGLSIVYSLTQLMGGHVLVESEVGKGSTFTVKIPTKHVAQKMILEKKEQILEIPKDYSILVVDDNDANQLVLNLMLNKLGIKHKMANNGQEAVDIASKEVFDLILMDCHMPVMDGFEACRRIKQLAPRPMICALTASVMDSDIKACEKAGMDQVLAKPVKKKDILNLVLNHVQQRHKVTLVS